MQGVPGAEERASPNQCSESISISNGSALKPDQHSRSGEICDAIGNGELSWRFSFGDDEAKHSRGAKRARHDRLLKQKSVSPGESRLSYSCPLATSVRGVGSMYCTLR